MSPRYSVVESNASNRNRSLPLFLSCSTCCNPTHTTFASTSLYTHEFKMSRRFASQTRHLCFVFATKYVPDRPAAAFRFPYQARFMLHACVVGLTFKIHEQNQNCARLKAMCVWYDRLISRVYEESIIAAVCILGERNDKRVLLRNTLYTY